MAPAGFWRRCAAWTLDATILAVPIALLTAHALAVRTGMLDAALSTLFSTLATQLDSRALQRGDVFALSLKLATAPDVRAAIDATGAVVHAMLLPPLLWFAAVAAPYWILAEASPWNATPGKRVLGLRVGRVDGKPLSLGRAALRHLSGSLSWLSLNLGHAMAAWTRDKRALHDMTAHTNVFMDDDTGTALPRWALAWLSLQAAIMIIATFWLGMRLSAMMLTAVDAAFSGI